MSVIPAFLQRQENQSEAPRLAAWIIYAAQKWGLTRDPVPTKWKAWTNSGKLSVFWPPQAPFTMHQAPCIGACSLFIALFLLHTKLKNCKTSHLFDDRIILLKVKLWSNEIPLHLLRQFEKFWANASKIHFTKDERCS